MACNVFTSRKAMAKTHGYSYTERSPIFNNPSDESAKVKRDKEKSNHQFSDSIGGDSSNYKGNSKWVST